MSSFADAVAALADLVEELGPPLPAIGYSLGGRLALGLALERPDLIDALVLVSASPGIRDPEERAARAARDEALAQRLERDGLDRFLAEWLASPLTGTGHLPDAVRRRDLAVRHRNDPLRLAAALRGLGRGAQPWLGDRLPELRPSLLAIAGSRDSRHVAWARWMAEAATGTAVVVDGAGHNLVLETPGRLAAEVVRFLQSQR